MNAVVVFHSVCGNSFLMARAFKNELEHISCSARLLRVDDPLWAMKPDVPQASQVILQEMLALPVAQANDLLEADIVLMGSPTYFGNVTAQMKTFMDSTGGLWFQGKLKGKLFAAFASAANAEGGGVLCLQALNTYAMYMGMLPVPVPVDLTLGKAWPALGLLQYSGAKYASVLDPELGSAIKKFAQWIIERAK